RRPRDADWPGHRLHPGAGTDDICRHGIGARSESAAWRCAYGRGAGCPEGTAAHRRRLAGTAAEAADMAALPAPRDLTMRFGGVDVRERVVLALGRRHGERHARRQAATTLERLGIGGLADRLVGQLAHGQRQLVELAMVVAPEPDLIILDEPTAGMSAEET